MLSPLATPDVAAQSAPAHGERELKFTLSEGRVDLARRWLERICRRDSKFPQAIVWTIYYDTPALVSLGEKINSDYLKQKDSRAMVLGPRRSRDGSRVRRSQASRRQPTFQGSRTTSLSSRGAGAAGIYRMRACVRFRCC